MEVSSIGVRPKCRAYPSPIDEQCERQSDLVASAVGNRETGDQLTNLNDDHQHLAIVVKAGKMDCAIRTVFSGKGDWICVGYVASA